MPAPNIYFQKTYQRAFGTYPLKDDLLMRSLDCALQAGYRAIDTAQMYRNEKAIGVCLAQSGLSRNDLCITTKVHPKNFSERQFIPSVESSLEQLQTDYVDVLLLHWPSPEGNNIPSLILLEAAYEQGLAKNVGVSNYTIRMLHQAQQTIRCPIVTNQVEFHPLLDQTVLLNATRAMGIPLSSYCSVARGKVFDNPVLRSVAEHYEKTIGQIVLHWILQKGVSVNIMSSNPDNIKDNFNVVDFVVSSADMYRIDALMQTNYRIVNSDLVPWAPEWD